MRFGGHRGAAFAAVSPFAGLRLGMLAALLAGLLIALSVTAPPVRAEFERTVTLQGRSLLLTDLVGEVRVEGYDGTDFQAVVSVRGEDATEDRIKIETHEGNDAQLTIRFPVEHEHHYVYPPAGHGTHSRFSASCLTGGRDVKFGWRELLHGLRDQVEVSGSGRGLEVWADVVLRVPRGASTEVRIGFGAIAASAVEGDLVLDTSAGPVTARGVKGSLVADTGSGSVTVSDVEGNLSIDTGSGMVEMTDCRGEEIGVDTGSGMVTANRITARALSVDTGSGMVKALAVSADEATIDTGSGGIELALDRMGGGEFRLDTGSGEIELTLPPEASARIEASSGSGGVVANVSGGQRYKSDDGELELTLGSGDAHVVLDTGSGSITVTQ
jgi:hypothetical protein